jgi:hypothetical protein
LGVGATARQGRGVPADRSQCVVSLNLRS